MKVRHIAAAVALMLSGSVYAVSPSEALCDASGGTFTRVEGVVMCVVTTTDNVGNSTNSSTTTTVTDTGGQGNTGNKTTTDSTCGGPGTSTTSAHCK